MSLWHFVDVFSQFLTYLRVCGHQENKNLMMIIQRMLFVVVTHNYVGFNFCLQLFDGFLECSKMRGMLFSEHSSSSSKKWKPEEKRFSQHKPQIKFKEQSRGNSLGNDNWGGHFLKDGKTSVCVFLRLFVYLVFWLKRKKVSLKKSIIQYFFCFLLIG